MKLPLKVLGIGANASTMGMVLLVHGELRYWQNSRVAMQSEDKAKVVVTSWITQLEPHAVVSEQLTEKSRKSERTQAVIRTVAETVKQEGVLSLTLPRPRLYRNKYEEAVALAKKYPKMKPWVPVRRFYDPEPKNVVLFEALALADAAQYNFSTRLAAAMG